MVKTSLPAVLLRGLVVLPFGDVRLEFRTLEEKKILENSEAFYDNYLLLVSLTDPLEQVPDIEDLPKIGVLCKVKLRMDLENGATRVVVSALNRVNILNYLNYEEEFAVLECEVSHIIVKNPVLEEEIAAIRKLTREIESYVNDVSYASNAILNEIEGVESLSRLTDVVASSFELSLERRQAYLYTINPFIRSRMILEDMKREREILELEVKLETELQNQLDKEQREFILREKIKIIKNELGDTSSRDDDIFNLRDRLNNLECPGQIKEKITLEINKYEMMSPSSMEINVVRNYIDTMLSLPWNKYTTDNNNLKKASQMLDESHYGLDKIKSRIIEFLAVRQKTEGKTSPIICLVGPPGTGKTTLVSSIASSLGRSLAHISVAGVSDEAELVGHRRAYIGASPGRIMTEIKKCGSSNPVFLIDEIDKMGHDYKGDPSAILLEVLDKEQNMRFSDNYIEEEYDLSKVLFIATANDVSLIPGALKDRLEIIELSGYTEYEKLDIVKKHLLKCILEEHGLSKENIIISDEAILSIIRSYTKESGVREAERLVSKIVRKIVTSMVIDKKNGPFKINNDSISEFLGLKKYDYNKISHEESIGLVNGLAYTSYGGDVMPIEVTYYKGKGNLVLTGSLGDVIKESASLALSYIKSNYENFNIDYDILAKNDIHVHIPEGATPKDGPSAGIAITTAIISSLTKKSVKGTIAMTGEITLRGKILQIGGLKEKLIGAYRSMVKEVILPYENKKDLEEVPKEIKDNINFKFVKNYSEVYEIVFKKTLEKKAQF